MVIVTVLREKLDHSETIPLIKQSKLDQRWTLTSGIGFGTSLVSSQPNDRKWILFEISAQKEAEKEWHQVLCVSPTTRRGLFLQPQIPASLTESKTNWAPNHFMTINNKQFQHYFLPFLNVVFFINIFILLLFEVWLTCWILESGSLWPIRRKSTGRTTPGAGRPWSQWWRPSFQEGWGGKREC